MLIIPAIDLKNGHCVRLLQGRKEEATVYDKDPVAVAINFVQAGARMLHVVDLDAAFGIDNSANRDSLKGILEKIDVPIQFGGGVRTRDDIFRLIDAGVARVIVGTAALESPQVLANLVANFGSKICVAIDARKGKVLVRGWEDATDVSATGLAKRVADAGVDRIIYTDTVRDGMLTGPNIEQTIEVARVSRLKVTASGGISSLKDITLLKNANEPLLDSVIVGKALYERKFSLEEAIQASAS
jgi:phosphoribosylformimino-5-aminoimidazole carboxamide ribotide isomerase